MQKTARAIAQGDPHCGSPFYLACTFQSLTLRDLDNRMNACILHPFFFAKELLSRTVFRRHPAVEMEIPRNQTLFSLRSDCQDQISRCKKTLFVSVAASLIIEASRREINHHSDRHFCLLHSPLVIERGKMTCLFISFSDDSTRGTS